MFRYEFDDGTTICVICQYWKGALNYDDDEAENRITTKMSLCMAYEVNPLLETHKRHKHRKIPRECYTCIHGKIALASGGVIE